MTLDALFRPRSIAVIGASRDRASLGGSIFHNIVSHGYAGPVYPVNPGAPFVQSVRAYPTIGDIPDPVDLAVVVVPRGHVLAAAEDCGRKGVKVLLVISAGFGEMGAEGKAAQQALVEVVRRYRMRLVGPNCLGVLNTDPATSLAATFAGAWPPTGDIAFSSQSGALGVAILNHANSLGVGIRHFVSVGNKADVSGNDLLEYWENDPGIKIILFYLESLGRPGRFLQIARRVGRKKPIIVVKSGRTAAGARAANSHTGALAGLDVAADALFGQAGALRTDSIEEMFDLAMLLDNQPVPKGDRVAILTNAGGPGIMATDACASRGLSLPPVSPATQEALRSFLPPEAALGNPVDMIASASAEHYQHALRLLLEDPAFDIVLVLYVPPVAEKAAAVAEAIRQGARGTTKPVLTCFMGAHGIPEAFSALREGRFPSYAFPEAAALALSRAVRYGRWLDREPGGEVSLHGVCPDAARRAIGTASGERWLSPMEVRDVLGAYGIATPAQALTHSAVEAAQVASEIGFPVALKLVSKTVTHKTEVGGVVLNLPHREAVLRAYDELHHRVAATGTALDAVLVQKMAGPGVETFLGVTQDPSYGPLIGFGAGGVNVEIWRDVNFRVHPLTEPDARDMIEQIRAVKLLDGYRGHPPADRPAITGALLRVSRMVADLPQILELDINPLLARAPGYGVVAVDARIRVRGD